MVKVFKALMFSLATVIMAICLIYIPESSGIIGGAFVSVLGIYLGLDLAGMITKTKSLPSGEFKALNKHKYILSGLSLGVLICVCLYMKNKADVSTCMTTFISAAMVLIACVIGGLEANGLVTGDDPNDKENK